MHYQSSSLPEMRDRFFDLLRDIKSIDHENAPNIVVTRKLYHKFIEKGFSGQSATVIVGRADINVDESFTNDTELMEETINTYVDSFVKSKEELDKINPLLFWERIERCAFTLRYGGMG